MLAPLTPALLIAANLSHSYIKPLYGEYMRGLCVCSCPVSDKKLIEFAISGFSHAVEGTEPMFLVILQLNSRHSVTSFSS